MMKAELKKREKNKRERKKNELNPIMESVKRNNEKKR